MPDPFPYTVLQVVPELDTGGVEQTVVDVARAVIEAGGKALVATKGGRLEAALRDMGASVHILPVHSKNPYTQFKNHYALKLLIKQAQVDIVHVRSRAPALSALSAARACGVKSVTTYHGIYNARGGLKRWYNAHMTRADLTIANSDYTRAHILEAYGIDPARVISIPRGVDLTRFDPEAISPDRFEALRTAWGIDPADQRTRFLLAGRLTRWKGQGLIIEALARLKDPNIQIILAGDAQGRTDYVTDLNDAIAEAGLGDQVKLVGHCTDMPAAYALCDFALAPSLEPEAFGRTAVEPQAMLRPVLAADHGATSETIDDGVTGWRVMPGDASVWAEALATAMDTPKSIRAAMGEAGRARVIERFSLEVMCARTLEVYRRLLGQSVAQDASREKLTVPGS